MQAGAAWVVPISMKKFVHYSALLCTHSCRPTEEMLMATGWKDDSFFYRQADCVVIKPTEREEELMIWAEMMPLDRLRSNKCSNTSNRTRVIECK
mmetsp:Transcript_22413/g.62526  ORF Transcript_22413/g.62526 Transcript_22413/m.62526 type:complete len:95 (-) Transcript_22413:15-299(-)